MWWFLAGCFVGGIMGVVVMCLIVAAGRASWERDEYERRLAADVCDGEPT